MTDDPVAIISYVESDDKHEKGALSQFRDELSNTLKFVSGNDFTIFYEGTDVKFGQHISERISQSLSTAMVLVPMLTPSFFKDKTCRSTLEQFQERERELGRNDLVLAVHYASVRDLDNSQTSDDPLIKYLGPRKVLDWRQFRGQDFTDSQVCQAIEELAGRINEILEDLQIAILVQQHQKNIHKRIGNLKRKKEDLEAKPTKGSNERLIRHVEEAIELLEEEVEYLADARFSHVFQEIGEVSRMYTDRLLHLAQVTERRQGNYNEYLSTSLYKIAKQLINYTMQQTKDRINSQGHPDWITYYSNKIEIEENIKNCDVQGDRKDAYLKREADKLLSRIRTGNVPDSISVLVKRDVRIYLQIALQCTSNKTNRKILYRPLAQVCHDLGEHATELIRYIGKGFIENFDELEEDFTAEQIYKTKGEELLREIAQSSDKEEMCKILEETCQVLQAYSNDFKNLAQFVLEHIDKINCIDSENVYAQAHHR
jgi:hypothetical protein